MRYWNINRIYAFLIILSVAGFVSACNGTAKSKEKEISANDSVDLILQKLQEKTQSIDTLQSSIIYTVTQPLFESKTVRTGVIFFTKNSKLPALRLNFEKIKQDDDDIRNSKEYYLIKGRWLTQINYQTEQIKIYELYDANDPNNPDNPFDLISQNFPLIGFTRAANLKKEFEIKLVESPEQIDAGKRIQLKLTPKKDSIYIQDYNSIDFLIDKQTFMPVKMSAASADKDIFEEIVLGDTIINEPLKESIFEMELSENFEKTIIPYKKSEEN